MNDFKAKYGPVALIAGASEGLGLAFSKAIAAHGLDLVLVARRENLLAAAASSIRQHYGVAVTEVIGDLAEDNVVEKIKSNAALSDINLLVYNGAHATIGPFLAQSITSQEKIVSINMITPLRLVHELGNHMMQQHRGGIILMSSLAGFQGSPFLATYASSKAFLRVFAESVWYEWKQENVDVLACCAGATDTPNYRNSNPGKKPFFSPRTQTPEAVVDECLYNLGRRPSFISGRGNRIATFVMQHFLTRKSAVTTMGKALRKLYSIDS